MFAFIRSVYKSIKRLFCYCCMKKKPPVMNEYFYEDFVQTDYVVCDV